MATASRGQAPRRQSEMRTPRRAACDAPARLAPPSAAPRAPAAVSVVSCDPPEERGKLADQAVAVEPLGDNGATGRAETSAKRGAAMETLQGVGDRRRLLRFDEQAAFTVLHQLGNPADIRGDDWQPGRHGFDEHVGNAVAIAIVGDTAGQAEDARA